MEQTPDTPPPHGGGVFARPARTCDLGEDYTATRDAWLAGSITGEHARAVTLGLKPVLARLPVEVGEEHRTAGEAFLLTVAGERSPDTVTRAATRLRFAVDQDGTDRAALDDYDASHLTLTPVGTGFTLGGYPVATLSDHRRRGLPEVSASWRWQPSEWRTGPARPAAGSGR